MVYVHLDAELYSWLLWKNKKSEVRTFFGSQNSKKVLVSRYPNLESKTR